MSIGEAHCICFNKTKLYRRSVFYMILPNRKTGQFQRGKIPIKNNNLDVFIYTHMTFWTNLPIVFCWKMWHVFYKLIGSLTENWQNTIMSQLFLSQVTKTKYLTYHITAKTWLHLLILPVKKPTWRVEKKMIWIKHIVLRKTERSATEIQPYQILVSLYFSRIEQGLISKQMTYSN